MKDLTELDLSTKKYIVFDMDGTLIDSVNIWNEVDARIALELGGTSMTYQEMQEIRENFLFSNHTCDTYLEYCNHLKNLFNIPQSKEAILNYRRELSQYYSQNITNYKPGIPELVKLLKTLNFTNIIASLTTAREIEIYSTQNQNMLSALKIPEYFDYIVTKEMVHSKKPHPEVYQNVINHYCAPLNEFIVFEDSLSGIISATTAGLETINIYDVHSSVDYEKIAELATYHIMSYQEIIDILKNNPPLAKRRNLS